MKTVTITIYRPEPKYDVQYYTNKAGKRLIDGDHPEERAELMVSNDEDDWFFERQYQLALANIRRATKYCLTTFVDSDETGDDKMQVIPASYGIRFRLPDQVREGFSKDLSTYSHTYISYFALSEWFKATAPAEAATCLETAQQALTSLVALFTEVPPQKRWYHEA